LTYVLVKSKRRDDFRERREKKEKKREKNKNLSTHQKRLNLFFFSLLFLNFSSFSTSSFFSRL